MGGKKCDLRAFSQPAFVLCVLLLAAAAGTKGLWGPIAKKEPLPLRKSLSHLDDNGVGPYEVASKKEIGNEEILKELGTEDYIQWVFEDPRESPLSPVRRMMLFITYYALPDRVPHVPEECYTGGGYQRLGTDSVVFDVNAPDMKTEVAGKYLLFGSSAAGKWLTDDSFPVLYFFKVNGEYADDRDSARIALNRNLFGRASYFSKVEIVFNRTSPAPDKAMATRAASRLLSVVLPVLEKEHWPIWEGRATRASKQPAE